jgi:hypothetical protein
MINCVRYARLQRRQPDTHLRAGRRLDRVVHQVGRTQVRIAAAAERELAQECRVAYGTIRRAAVLLRERGLIITVHGRGTYVA